MKSLKNKEISLDRGRNRVGIRSPHTGYRLRYNMTGSLNSRDEFVVSEDRKLTLPAHGLLDVGEGFLGARRLVDWKPRLTTVSKITR